MNYAKNGSVGIKDVIAWPARAGLEYAILSMRRVRDRVRVRIGRLTLEPDGQGENWMVRDWTVRLRLGLVFCFVGQACFHGLQRRSNFRL